MRIGQADLGAESAQLGGAAEGDAVLIGDADDEPALAAQHVADADLRVPDLGQRIDGICQIYHRHGLAPIVEFPLLRRCGDAFVKMLGIGATPQRPRRKKIAWIV